MYTSSSSCCLYDLCMVNTFSFFVFQTERAELELKHAKVLLNG